MKVQQNLWQSETNNMLHILRFSRRVPLLRMTAGEHPQAVTLRTLRAGLHLQATTATHSKNIMHVLRFFDYAKATLRMTQNMNVTHEAHRAVAILKVQLLNLSTKKMHEFLHFLLFINKL